MPEKATHLPGPWQSREYLPHCWAIEQPGHMPHATVHPRIAHADPEDDDPADVRVAAANARLIAAAPNLLAACRAVADNWETGDLAAAARLCADAAREAGDE
ncbi:MAG: hypothetical protein IT577_15145 [Verrucomicrobiae bacterium]|nr:hypothetical protein [Verrucomicrobiae bacterium]